MQVSERRDGIQGASEIKSRIIIFFLDINVMKVQLVNRIMRMDEPKEVLSVLNFVKNQKDEESEFDREWNRSLSVEEFRIQCKNRLKEIYVGSGN